MRFPVGFADDWARCAPWLEAALEHCGHTHSLDDVRACVERGTASFWPGAHAALVTEIVSLPCKTVLNFWLGGGNLTEIRDHLVPRAEAHGKTQGCTMAVINGRQGWAKALGYSPLYYTCAKEL